MQKASTTRSADPSSRIAADRTGGSRLRWFLGGLAAWSLVWLAQGLSKAVDVYEQPHPWIPYRISHPMIRPAVLEWALGALLTYCVLALLVQLALAGLLRLQGSGLGPRPFRGGLLAGLGTCLWFQGVLYLQVPMALADLPGLNHLPFGLLFLGLFGGGFWAGWLSLAHAPRRARAWVPVLALLALATCVPHDLFRPSHGPALEPGAPRVALVSFDALRRDSLEKVAPQWHGNPQVKTITVMPSTKVAWTVLLGGDPNRAYTSKLVPTSWECAHPENLSLLVEARRQGLRTAFAIDDSLSPGFSYQPNLFDQVAEPKGGWKYWFSYGYGTTWPAYAWQENLFSPIETDNPWSDSAAWFRDLGRLLRNHAFLASHNCELHSPIIMRTSELQRFDPWRWLIHSPFIYMSYENVRDEASDTHHARATWRSDGKAQYEVRVGRLVRTLAPYLEAWSRTYPALSGLVLSDHGEAFPAVKDPQGQTITRQTGFHGFHLDNQSLAIPIHPFGQTVDAFHPGDVFSLLDLRDALRTWMMDRKPLALHGQQDGWMVSMICIDSTHMEALASGSSTPSTQGVSIEAMALNFDLFANGSWRSRETSLSGQQGALPIALAYFTGTQAVVFNPKDATTYTRVLFTGATPGPVVTVTRAEVARELAAFKGHRAFPGVVDGADF